MKQKVIIILALLFSAVLPVGCGANDTVYLEQVESGMQASAEEQDESGSAAPGADGTADGAPSVGQDGASVDGASAGGEASAGQEPETCYVYVCGAVCEPGVYILEQGSRIYEAVAMAGGLAEDASAGTVNQAEPVYDGQMVYIPTAEEAAAGGTATGSGAGMETGGGAAVETDTRVNLNTASAAELMTLSGIGEAKAQSILEYRDKNGGFSSVEEIMQVDGIKEGLYNRIKDDIRVN